MMKSRRLSWVGRPLAAAVVVFMGSPAIAAPDAKAVAAIDRGLEYLGKEQKENGCWSTAEFPGMTALALQGFLLAPEAAKDHPETVKKGLGFLRASAKPDGGIYDKGMANYNTSIALSTLLHADDDADLARIEAARKFLVGAQKHEPDKDKKANDGGFGYEPEGRRSRPDLDNTVFAVESLALYRDKHKGEEPIGKEDLDWQAAIDFVSRCQNLTETNSATWASDEPAEKGGFTYTPDGSGENGSHSYGTMTYSGLLSLIHAKVGADDKRVKAAIDWLSRRYSVEENPGQGKQGLYYYYFVMAKTLTTAKIDKLKAGEKEVDWRTELAAKLISLQRADGSWANENGRWMEQDPVLATSYAVIALSMLAKE
ncbi:prenyltransferase/squalene oxidase repeat-containing protein [Luteolibacter soli]|uniref:Prenyltransferase/squalene oxidase repeat-containing protein n=1 Tax=Luteolibacter soli TaxID=3135280 RepID=A0ABU9AZ90_9BACT